MSVRFVQSCSCTSVSVQVCHYASVSLCKHMSIQVSIEVCHCIVVNSLMVWKYVITLWWISCKCDCLFICKFTSIEYRIHASMSLCKHVIMQACHYASMSLCKRVIMQVCHYASVSFCKRVIMQACEYASMWVCKFVITLWWIVCWYGIIASIASIAFSLLFFPVLFDNMFSIHY